MLATTTAPSCVPDLHIWKNNHSQRPKAQRLKQIMIDERMRMYALCVMEVRGVEEQEAEGAFAGYCRTAGGLLLR